MMPTVRWQGQDRRIIRAARPTDEDFDPDAEEGSQVVVKMGGGEEVVVPKEGDGSGDTAPPEEGGATIPPSVVDAPYASQEGAYLDCTMGNWNGEPDAYAYQWQCDGEDVGLSTAAYPIIADDVGKSFTCTVTASNALGSASSTSNAIIVTEP